MAKQTTIKEPKNFTQPDTINQDFISEDNQGESINKNKENNDINPVITDDLTLLKFYSEELLVSLEGIFIGGRAAQKRDQLFEFLQKLK